MGHILTSFKGLKFDRYYFTEKDLYKHLNDINFKNIEIISLEEFSKKNYRSYDRLKVANNFTFFATKY